MSEHPYYLAYEERYQKVYEAGAERWGHLPDDKALVDMLTKWVDANALRGKKVIEFACGEGASGVILSQLGCEYHGVDIAPSAVKKARETLSAYPNASISQLDMVKQAQPGLYDAALDVMGFHMLVVDADRMGYLKNVYACLRQHAPMLFFRESYAEDAPDEPVETMEAWLAKTGSDYITPQKRSVSSNGKDVEVYIPLVPGRGRSKEGYLREMHAAGFIVEDFVEMTSNMQCVYSASIFVRKP